MNLIKSSKTKKVLTGIRGLDEVLEGGFPEGRTMLIHGSTGTGKTVLLNEFLYRGITKYDQPGIFVTFEEKPEYIIRNTKNFNWDYDKLIQEKKLKILDFTPDIDVVDIEADGDYTLNAIIEQIKFAIKSIDAKRVVIDNLGTLYDRYSQKNVIRSLMLKLAWQLNEMGVVSLISAEAENDKDKFSRHGVEEFVADGVIGLKLDLGDQEYKRSIFVRKIRGESYRSGVVELEIDQNGMRIYPKIPHRNFDAKTNYDIRKMTGVKGLDKALNGGVPEGHVMMISGNTGTGKSLLGLHFLIEGIKKGETAFFIALEEPVEQVKKTALSFGWDLEKYEKDGKLKFITANLIDFRPDKLLYDILDECKKTKTKRLVLDSISSLESATFDSDKVRQFLIQLTGFVKENGITCFCNYLSGTNFGASKDQLLASQETNKMKLSSIIDGVVLLLYVEKENRVDKILNVLKLRGSKHERSILEYEINDKGIEVGERVVTE